MQILSDVSGQVNFPLEWKFLGAKQWLDQWALLLEADVWERCTMCEKWSRGVSSLNGNLSLTTIFLILNHKSLPNELFYYNYCLYSIIWSVCIRLLRETGYCISQRAKLEEFDGTSRCCGRRHFNPKCLYDTTCSTTNGNLEGLNKLFWQIKKGVEK